MNMKIRPGVTRGVAILMVVAIVAIGAIVIKQWSNIVVVDDVATVGAASDVRGRVSEANAPATSVDETSSERDTRVQLQSDTDTAQATEGGKHLQSARDARQQLESSDHLPAEGLFLRGKNVDLDRAKSLVSASDAEFQEMVGQLRREMLTDPLASEQDQLYRSGIDQRIKANMPEGAPQVALDAFACGLRVCVGALTNVPDDVDLNDWWTNTIVDHLGLPVFVGVGVPHVEESGLRQFRFILTPDPGSSAATFSMRPAPVAPAPPDSGG